MERHDSIFGDLHRKEWKMSRSALRAATLVVVCAVLVTEAASAGGAKTAAKGRRTRGSAFLADTRMVGGKTYSAGAGIDRILGPAAVTLVFQQGRPTSQPGVVNVLAKPVTLWLRTGTMVGAAKLLLNTITGRLTGHATFKGATGTLKGHSLVASFVGSADLAKGRFHYTYTGVYK
jgi:hypothetical protein